MALILITVLAGCAGAGLSPEELAATRPIVAAPEWAQPPDNNSVVAAPAWGQTPDNNPVINAYRAYGPGTPSDNFVTNAYQQYQYDQTPHLLDNLNQN
jgi:hypothetical protein